MDGAAVIYGPCAVSFTVTATLDDATAGLEAVTFPEAVSAGETYTQALWNRLQRPSRGGTPSYSTGQGGTLEASVEHRAL